MDFPGLLGRTDRALGIQVCAWCSDGPKYLIKLAVGKGTGRGAKGLLGGCLLNRPVPELSDEEYELWCLEWLATWLNGMANAINRSGLEMRVLDFKWHK